MTRHPAPRPLPCPGLRLSRRPGSALAAALLSAGVAAADSGSGLDAALEARVRELASQSAMAAIGTGRDPRLEVSVGPLDARLRLAPCQRVDVQPSAGAPALGRTRIGLRCAQGPVAWNVHLPVTVRAWVPGVVLNQALPAGSVIDSTHLGLGDVDLAVGRPIVEASEAIGRTLARSVAAAAPLNAGDLRARQWFNAGDTVRLVVQGPGFQVSAEGRALSPGLEGQTVRVRTEAGRVVDGLAVGQRLVQVSM